MILKSGQIHHIRVQLSFRRGLILLGLSLSLSLVPTKSPAQTVPTGVELICGKSLVYQKHNIIQVQATKKKVLFHLQTDRAKSLSLNIPNVGTEDDKDRLEKLNITASLSLISETDLQKLLKEIHEKLRIPRFWSKDQCYDRAQLI